MSPLKGLDAFIVIALFFLVGCNPIRPSTIQSPSTGANVEMSTKNLPSASLSSQDSWKEEWERILKAARTEGKVLIVSTTGPQVRNILGQAFQAKFGIQAEFTASKGAEVTARLSAERKGGSASGGL